MAARRPRPHRGAGEVRWDVSVVQVHAGLVDAKGRLRVEQAGLLAFAHGEYFALGRSLGRFGFSVRKRKRKT